MRRRDAPHASVIALVACILCVVFAPVAADVLSPYVVPSRGESMRVLTTRSDGIGGVTIPFTLTPDQLADPHGAVAMIYADTPPSAFGLFISRVAEVAMLGNPNLEAFALRYSNGSIQLSTPITSALPRAFLYDTEWLQGPYAAMATGESHLCFLLESGFVECRAASVPVTGFDVSSGVLMEARAGVRFSQITAANCFTCALRADDSKVECFGDVTSAWLDPVPPAVRITLNSSLLQYSVIASQYAGGWCGLTLDATGRDLYCWTLSSPIETLALPTPTAPLFWRAPFFSSEQTRGCALRNDGRFACNFTDGTIWTPDFSEQVAVSDLTPWRMQLDGATASTGTLLDYYGYFATEYPLDFAFSPIRLIGVDATQGDDARCAAVNTLSPAELMNFVPCRTFAGAMQQLTRRNTWIHFLPGTHFGGDAVIGFVDVTLSSHLPPVMTASEVASIGNGSWVQRMADASTLDSVVLLNCSGFVHCVSSDFQRLSLLDLAFTGASEHAIVHTCVLPQNIPVMELELTIVNCNFTEIGGVLRKTNGRALIRGCNVENSTQSENVRALLDCYDVTFSLESTTFDRHYFLDSPDQDTALRTCVSINATRGLAVSITECRFNDAHASSPASFENALPMLGGAAIQVFASSVSVSITDCVFTSLSTQSSRIFGGAIGVFSVSPVIATTNSVSITVRGCVFEQCSTSPVSRGGGGAIAILEHNPLDTSALGMGASVIIESCRFTYVNSGEFGGAILIGSVSALTISDVQLLYCRSQAAGVISITQSEARAILFPQSVFVLTRITANSCSSLQGGVLFLSFINTPVQLTSSYFYDLFAGSGGAIYMESGQSVELQDVHVLRSVAGEVGGAIYISTIQRVSFSDCSFGSASSLRAGGALFVQYSKLDMTRISFEDCSLYESLSPIESATSRHGGALYLLGGSMTLINATFTRCTALPTTMSLANCADSYDPASGICSEGQGGSISVELSQVELRDIAVSAGRACTGGFLLLNGADTMVLFLDVRAIDMEAWSGGIYAFRDAKTVQLSENLFNNSVARSNGGAITFAGTLQADLYKVIVGNVSCTPLTVGAACDGGAVWATSQRYFEFLPSLSTFQDVTAAGAGAVFFTHLQSVTPAALDITLPLSKINLNYMQNSFLAGLIPPPFAQYGQRQASSAVSLTSPISSLSIYPGQLLDAQLPILALTVRDGYGQAMTMDRSLVVRLKSNPVDSSAAAAGHAALATFAGTTLQPVHPASGAANFSSGDLRINAPPGNYMLRFSVVSLPDLMIDVSLRVIAACPAGLMYAAVLRTCIGCPSDLLVYNATANACEQCPAGWQRVALTGNATGGPLNDGISCEACPLGSVSTSGSRCSPCPPNTYQPTPFASCVQCSDIAGLQCAGDGLAKVEKGYFALSVTDGAGGARIETFQCPDEFCSAAKVQVAAVAAVSADLAAGAPASSASAVNSFGQCAFPRLASPTNLLCGECAEGYRPWGNRCSRCDSVDGGLMFGLIVLSLVLLSWLIRSSLGSPSAGHAVVVLYFVQTAMLELGSLNTLLAWLNVVLLSPNSVGRCVAPLTPYEQTQAQILMPVALWIELCFIAMVHFLTFKRWGSLAAQEPAVSSSAPLVKRIRASALLFVSQFSFDLYISSTLSLLLFSYTQVAGACVSYLRCVDVGGVSVVFSQPSMRCESDEYARTKVLVIFALVTYVAGLPVGIAAFLWKRSDAVREAHAALVTQVHGPRVVSASITSDASEAEINGVVVVSSSASSAVSVNRFLLRYAPLFAMYSSSAWFWQVIVLARRTAFVVISVMLLPTPRRRFMAFALATLVSSLLQLIFSPFRLGVFNRVELGSQSLLLILAITLTSESSPYSDGVNTFVFMLVVPPLCLYVIWAAGSKIVGAKLDRDRVYAAKEREQLELEAAIDAGLTRNPSVAHPQAAAAFGVEMLPVSTAPSDSLDSVDQARL